MTVVKRFRCCAWTLLLWASLAAAAAAQAVSTASLGGTVKDDGGGVLPGVTVTATQTATGQIRTTVTSDTGDYTLNALPVGPYRIEFALQGFKSFVQSGVVLQVGTSPTINAVLGVGELSETVQVQATAPLVETRNPGLGQVIDNERVQELPLNGRNATDLILLSGIAVQSGTLSGIRGGVGTTQTIAIAGGLANGSSYLLDGGYHNDPMNNAPQPFPFPEALQEFKVETSALTAQYGRHSAGAVNAITKSGTNTFNGTIFEFYRDAGLNATDPFASVNPDTGKRRDDGLKRHQTGGTLGGPIVRNKMFFFGGYQGTFLRQKPASAFEFVPTAAMLRGDFTAVTSPACNSGRQIALRAPFVNNQTDPALFSRASLAVASRLTQPIDACGKAFYDQVNNQDEHMLIGKVDYTLSGNHMIFGRMEYQKQDSPASVSEYINAIKSTDVQNRLYSFVFGDTLVMTGNTVNSIRVTANRGDYHKYSVDILDAADLGIPVIPPVPGLINVNVTGGFSMGASPAQPGDTPTRAYQFADDLTTIKGAHTLGFGANYIRTVYNSVSYLRAVGANTFSGQVTGLGLADFLLGRSTNFGTGVVSGNTIRANYIGIYGQDSWRLSPNVTVNYGLRWEPYLPIFAVDGHITHFDRDAFNQSIRSTVFPNAPPGLMFPGDPGMPDGNKIAKNQWWNFSPRLSIVWDPTAEGRQTLRASYGHLYDMPHLQTYSSLPQMPPFGNNLSITNLPNGWEDPWAAYPGGNPQPFVLSKDFTFPLGGSYTSFPVDQPATNVHQWNASYQQQVGANVAWSVNYLATRTRNAWTTDSLNPAVYIPGASTANNVNARRELTLQDPVWGPYYSAVVGVLSEGQGAYDAVAFQLQRRRAAGFTLQGTYTYSQCTSDVINYEPGTAGNTYMVPHDRERDHARCNNTNAHIFSGSIVYSTPTNGQGVLGALTGGWQISSIVSARSGGFLTVTTGVDSALTGQNAQRANQVLDDPFVANPTYDAWLNPAAFAVPAAGSYGTMPLDAFEGPGRWNIDANVSRNFRVTGSKQLQLRIEAFNLLNHANPANPVTNLSNANFGKVISLSQAPRVIQVATKLSF